MQHLYLSSCLPSETLSSALWVSLLRLYGPIAAFQAMG